MPKQLLYITDAEGLGGAEAYLETLMLHVDQARFRVELMLPPRPATTPLVERAQAHGVSITYLDQVHHEGLRVGSILRAAALLRRLQPEIVHFVLPSPRRSAETVIAAWLAGVPQRIATFQLVTPIPQFRGLTGALRALNRTTQFRTLTHGIAVSRGNMRLLVEQYGFPVDRLALIYNGVDLAHFARPTNASELRDVWHVPPDAPLLGVVGRLSRQKGHAVLLAALPQVWACFPEVHVVFVGAGEMEAELRDQAARIDETGRIHFAGKLSRDDMVLALAAFDVFVLPSLYEGLPFAVVEAMAAGKPIVATRVDGTAEAITEDVTGMLVPPGDAPSLAAALIRLLGNSALRLRLGQAARAEAVRRFDQHVMLANTFQLYER